MFRTTIAVTLLSTSLTTLAACSSDSSESNGSSSRSTFKCQVSAAESGGLCQVNFFCDGGDGPAAYCIADDGSCSCGPAASDPKKFTSAGICQASMDERAEIANRECGFGM